MKIFLSSIFCTLLTFLFLVNASASETLSYSGRLVNPNGSPVVGPVNLKVELAYSNSPTVIRCSQNFTNIILSNGVFHLNVNFDCGSPVTLSQVLTQIPANESAAIRVTNITDPANPKVYSFQALHSMPFANIAETAKQLVQMAATDGQVLKWSNANAKWEPGAAGGGGTVTSVSGTLPISVATGSSTPVISMPVANTSTSGYLSSADWNSFNTKEGTIAGGTALQYYRGDKSWQTLNTSVVPESGVTNLYFSNARVLGVPLDGFVAGPGAIVATDTVLQAFAKTQGQINLINTNSSAYVTKTGTSTMAAGTIDAQAGFVLVGTPGSINDATPRGYVDTQDNLKVNKAGDTMSGVLTLDNDLKMKGGANYVTLKSHATSATYNLFLPQNAGTSGFVLSTDGSGNTTWINPSSVANGNDTVTSASIVNDSIVDADINASAAIAQSKIANLSTDLAGKEPTVTNPSDTSKYYRGDKSWQALNTTVVAEGSNLYFLNARVLGTDLLGLNTGVAGPITAVDTVLGAFGKLQYQVTDLKGKGQWEKNVNNIYYNAGNVGIGTTSPLAKLQIDYPMNNGASKYSWQSGTGLLINNPSFADGGEVAKIVLNTASGGYNSGAIIHVEGAGSYNAGQLVFSTGWDAAGNGTERMRIKNDGKVGIGTATPRSKLEVLGGIQIGADAVTCDATKVGTLRYNAGNVEYCNGGPSWQAFGVSGGGITNINGSTNGTQSFANGSTGTTPAWSTAAGVHTLNIPLASGAGVTAGLISKTDYDAFNNKLGTTLNSGNIWVGNGSNAATAVTPSSDVSMTNAGAFTVTKLQGKAVSTTAPVLGSFLKWDNVLTQWAPTPFSTCSGANEVMHYILLTDTWSCDTLNVDNLLPAQATNSGKVLTTNGTTATWQTPATGVGGTGTTNYLPKFTAASTLGNSRIFDNGTNVGIGIAAPTDALHVEKNALGYQQISMRNSTNGAAAVYVRAGASAIDAHFFANMMGVTANGIPSGVTGLASNNSPFAISVNGSERMRFELLGNVGIGTTTPNAKLDVNGEIVTSSGGTVVGRVRSLNLESAPVYAFSGANTGMWAPTTTSLGFSTDGVEKLRITQAGNVGIGTATPGAKLEVAGQVKITGGTPGLGKVLTSNAAGLATWETPAVGGITSLNGLVGTTQAFAIPGTAGTAPNWSSSGTDHTINIPMAATAGVTAGLISKTDYDAFNSKLGTTLNSGNIWVGNGSNVATSVTPSSDVSMTNAGAFTVTKLQGNSVSTTAPVLGSFLKWDNILSQWAPTPLATCSGANQVMHYILLTDTWSCDTLNIDNLLPTQTANNGKILKTDGTNASWQTLSAPPAGNNTEVQFNNSGVMGASSTLKWNSTPAQLYIGDNNSTTSSSTRLYVTKYYTPAAGASNPTLAQVRMNYSPSAAHSLSGGVLQGSLTGIGTAAVSGAGFSGVEGSYTHQSTGVMSGEAIGVMGKVFNSAGGGNLTGKSIGVQGMIYGASSGTAPSFTEAIGVQSKIQGAGGGTLMSTAVGFQAEAQTLGTDTISTLIGLKVLAPTGTGTVTNKYAIITEAGAGNVGIGTITPGTNTALNVAGQIKSGSGSITTGAVDWVSGNSITTSFDCGTNITLANLRDGGSYTLVVTGTGTTQCTFSTTTTGDDAATVTYRFKPTNGVRTASSHTVYSLLRIGTIVYVSWISGF